MAHAPMRLSYFEPCAALRRYLGVYYLFETDIDIVQPVCAELGNIRFILRGGGDIAWPDGRKAGFPAASVVGPTMSAYTFTAAAGTRALGVGLLPVGWDALFGFSAEVLVDKVEEISAILGGWFDSETTNLQQAPSPHELVSRVDDLFMRLLANRAGRPAHIPDAFDEWLLNPHGMRIDDLVASLGVSRRQTDRLAKYYYGASPKALQRKYRALHALTRISLEGAAHWFDETDQGFYDQSHFIKEFKVFAGITPGEFIGEKAVLMADSIKKRSRATHRHPGVRAPGAR